MAGVTRLPNYIVKTQPCLRRRTVTKSEGIFEAFDRANRLPSRLYFGFGWIFVYIKMTESGKSSMADPGRGFGRAAFQTGTPFSER